jgi:hypothetical protein
VIASQTTYPLAASLGGLIAAEVVAPQNLATFTRRPQPRASSSGSAYIRTCL